MPTGCGYGSSAVAARSIFSAPVPAEGKPSYGKVDVNGHALLFAVNKVNPGDIKEVTAEQQKQLKDRSALEALSKVGASGP